MSQPSSSGERAASKQRFRESILGAALDVFSEKGFQDAQISEIALRAQVAVGTLYSLFENKENLYKQVLQDHAVEIAVAFNEVFESGDDPYSKLLRYIRAKGEIFQTNSKAVRLYFSRMSGARLNVRATLSEQFKPMYDLLLMKLAEIFQAGIDQGQFKARDPFTMAVALDSTTNAFIILWMDQPEKHRYPERVDEISAVFFDSILTESTKPRAATTGANINQTAGGDNA